MPMYPIVPLSNVKVDVTVTSKASGGVDFHG